MSRTCDPTLVGWASRAGEESCGEGSACVQAFPTPLEFTTSCRVHDCTLKCSFIPLSSYTHRHLFACESTHIRFPPADVFRQTICAVYFFDPPPSHQRGVAEGPSQGPMAGAAPSASVAPGSSFGGGSRHRHAAAPLQRVGATCVVPRAAPGLPPRAPTRSRVLAWCPGWISPPTPAVRCVGGGR